MATLSLKPTQRFAPSDWFSSNELISTNAERQRVSSHQIRQESRALANVTANQTKWDQHDNNTRLDNRIDDITKWRETLERCLAETDDEIRALNQSKLTTEQALEAKALPLDVAIECLTLREGRQSIDMVRDNVEAELHKEVEVIEGIKGQLQKRIAESFEQLCLLQEARQQLQSDLKDKTEAQSIDRTCYAVNNESAGISYKPNPTRVPKESTTPEAWHQFSQYNKDRAEAEMRASVTLREATAATLAQTRNELEAQRNATEFAYRKRIHETERAEGELEWQRKNTKEEIEEVEADIRNLEEAIRAKAAPLKVAHTRLETRTYRPNVELCRDKPQYGLVEEVRQIEGSISQLKEKLAQAHHARDALYKHLYRIEEDLACKRNSLDLDRRCVDVRRKLIVPAETFVAERPSDDFSRTQQRRSTPVSPIKTSQLDLE
uniref:tektin-2-like n=1 Tax=Styela clava TaxID=7725 RepID=UPI00193A1976|nr:tektin-2-like [Styela clava]